MYSGKHHYLAGVFALAAIALSLVAHAAEMDALKLLRAGDYKKLDDHYSAVQRKFDSGKISGDELRNEFRVFYPVDGDLAAKYDDWVAKFPDSYVARLARGIYYKRVGLDARGGRYISETSSSQLDEMDAAFRKAVKDLGASVSLDPKPFLSYFHTMDIGRQYLSNADMRKVFDGAAALDPKSLGLRTKLMMALKPRWGGSTQEMRAFLEESRNAHMPVSDVQQLEAMVYDEEGTEYRTAGNLSAAESAYRKSLSLGPCPCENVRNDLNNVLFETHQYQAAVELLDQYLRDSPTDLWALANRGSAKVALIGRKRPSRILIWQQIKAIVFHRLIWACCISMAPSASLPITRKASTGCGRRQPRERRKPELILRALRRWRRRVPRLDRTLRARVSTRQVPLQFFQGAASFR